jgi:hypothetical protein
MQHGVLSAGRSYSTLYWLSATTIQVFTTTLTKDNNVWPLADSPQALVNYDKSSISFGRGPHPVGEVGAVGWSPVGDQIAFWATLEPIGQSEVFLRSWTWDLYLIDVRTQQVERVLDDVYEGGGVQWSPDGQDPLHDRSAEVSRRACGCSHSIPANRCCSSKVCSAMWPGHQTDNTFWHSGATNKKKPKRGCTMSVRCCGPFNKTNL